MLEWGRKQGGLVPILLDGEPVAHVDPEFWREGAELTIADQTWEFAGDRRERVARLQGSTEAYLRARKKSFFNSDWVIAGDGVTYEISRRGFGTAHHVRRDGQEIGTGKPASFWSGRATLDLDPSVPPVDQLFLLWISHIIRQRDSNAAAAASP